MGKVSESYVTELSQAVPNEAANPLLEKHGDAVSEPAAVRLWLRLLTCSLTIEKRVRRRHAVDFQPTFTRLVVLAGLEAQTECVLIA